MLIISHRGYPAAHVPENTYEAFENAVALGVDGIETDVRMSADGKLILFHNRLAPNGSVIASLTHSDLSALVEYDVPILEVALGKWDKVLWNLEIKTPAVLEATIAVIRRLSRPQRYLITSFWHPVVEQASRCLEVNCGILVAHRPLDPVLPSLGWRPEHRRITTIVWDYEVLDTHLLEQTAAQGMCNFVYGAETLHEHQRCIDLKIDGIITDHPEFLVQTHTKRNNY